MGFKVVNIFPLPGLDFGDELLDPLDATLEKGMSMTEEEIISRARDADAIIGVVSVHPFNRRLLTALPQCRIIAGIGISDLAGMHIAPHTVHSRSDAGLRPLDHAAVRSERRTGETGSENTYMARRVDQASPPAAAWHDNPDAGPSDNLSRMRTIAETCHERLSIRPAMHIWRRLPRADRRPLARVQANPQRQEPTR